MTGAPDRIDAAVLGAAGYVGGELLRLLAAHPRVGRLRAFSESHAGLPASALHPALGHLPPLLLEAPAARGRSGAGEALFLALAHGESQKLMRGVLEEQPALVIDLAADFRVRDAGLRGACYGEHAAPDLVDTFVYGLTDTCGPESGGLGGARRIAAPGCFATAALLALFPLARAGLLTGPAVLFAATGSSGAGAKPKPTTHHPVRGHNFFGYARGGHRHEAEICEQLRGWTGRADAACRLLVHSGPWIRGIHAVLHARLARPLADPVGLYRDAYRERPFVRVLDAPAELAAVAGTNFAHLHAAAREDGRELVVDAAIDNLVKGAAGQAVQAMNLALGFPEAAGLEFAGLYPC